MSDQISKQIRSNRSQQGGYVLLLAILLSVTLFIALGGIVSLGVVSLSSAKRSTYDLSALYVAETGIDNATFQVNANASYTGTNTVCPIGTTGENPVTLFSSTSQGKGTYEDCVTAGSIGHELIVYSEAKIYKTPSDTHPISSSTVKAVLEGSQTGGYAVETGPGGLILSNSATILPTGPIAIGGFLTMSNSATIGTASNPVTLSVANERCPSPATASYPQICGSNPNPITITNTAHIYGAVTANGQTNNSGMSNSGLVASSGAVPPTLPTYNRSGQTGAVTSTLTAANASCSGSQTVTWAANVHITGTVNLSNNCTILVSGNAWIDGNLNTSNSSVFKPAAGVTTTPTVMVDGSSGIVMSNTSKISTNAANVGFQFITYYSTAPCSPGCATVTGSDLYNSQSVQTVSTSNQTSASGSSFEAMWTKINLSNQGSLGTVMAQTIQMSNTGNISFNSSSGTGGWVYEVKYYEVL